jgi:hypothetical protein
MDLSERTRRREAAKETRRRRNLKMTDTRAAEEEIRCAIDSATKGLDDASYLEVLETIKTDCEAMIEAKEEEIEAAE